jgi:hypothetical protein
MRRNIKANVQQRIAENRRRVEEARLRDEREAAAIRALREKEQVAKTK